MGIGYYIKWLWKASRGCRMQISANCITGIVRVCTSLFFIWCTKVLVDMATGHVQGNMLLYVCLLVGCIILQTALSAAAARLNVSTGIRMMNRMRHILFTRVMESRWKGREGIHSGDIMNRLETDVRTVTDLLCRTMPSLAVTAIQLLLALALLWKLDGRLVWIVSGLFLLTMLISRRYTSAVRHINREIRDTDSKVQSHIQENIQNRTVIATLERIPEMTDTLSDIQDSLRHDVMTRTNYSLFSRTVIQLGFSAGYVLVFLWGISGLMNGTMSFGTLTAFMQLVNQIQRPMSGLGRTVPAIIRATASVDRLAELYDIPAEDKGKPVRLTGQIGIRLDNVSFAYETGGENIIENISHDFTPGSITAITGITGAGKSTLVRLILALVRPDSGKITLYNDSVSAEASPDTRCNITYIPQGNTLISGTIRDNLLLGNPEASEEDIRSVLHTAVADFVLELPDGLDTLCGESGSGLSEGQAQRIAIARGLLRDGGVILLDEPTSALDKDTELTLLSRLTKAESGKTLIIVSHSRTVPEFCGNSIELAG